VERGSVYLSPRFDLYPAGHLWTKGSGARCCGCVLIVRCVLLCCVLYH
jgi:hypothetical protein